MKDFRGELIQAGTKIVYPVRHGSYVHMKEATVEFVVCSCGHYATTSIGTCETKHRLSLIARRDGKKLILSNPQNVVVVR